MNSDGAMMSAARPGRTETRAGEGSGGGRSEVGRLSTSATRCARAASVASAVSLTQKPTSDGCADASACSTATAMSAAVPQRRAGSRSRPRSTTASTAAGSDGTRELGGGTGIVSTFLRVVASSTPSKRGSWVRASHSTIAAANTSALRPTGVPRICSGARYDRGRPRAASGCASLAIPRAMPNPMTRATPSTPTSTF